VPRFVHSCATLWGMGTTPLWVPLVVAFVAVVGTLAGVIFTQVWNSRLDERRWARENERLREVQAREDSNRTYEHRRAAYIDFLQEFERLQHLYITGEPDKAPPVSDLVFAELSDRWTAVSVYGTPEADSKASQCLVDLLAWAHQRDDPSLAEDALDAREAYLSQIRKDLGVPDRQPTE
jgi:hypothetical protein